MRLTLRTLLAYLDDTLEPTEIKAIGQKVTESETAQELIARIKQVTRRRRLTTPPPGGTDGRLFDENKVAEYLDNELDSEQVAEIEKLCLESDVHLAEIATCHQILTLVLGEPALVPPTAKERMYGLVKGREAIPFRKAPQRPSPSTGALDESLDNLQPFGRLRTAWTIWAGALAGLCLLVVLAVALYRAPLGDSGRTQASNGKNAVAKDDTGKDNKDSIKDKAPPEKNGTDATPPREPNKDNDKDKTPAIDKPVAPVTPTPAGNGDPKAVKRAAPSPDRRELATYSIVAGVQPSVLVTRPKDGTVWRRVTPGSRIASTEPLVSLPGCPSELRLEGVRLQLWGCLPEFTPIDFLLESAVILHASPNLDLDFTLERGRVFISNTKEKGPAHVRVRFNKEIWDLTLQERGTEIGIDFSKKYTADIDYSRGEEPRAELYLCVLKGKAGIKTDYQEYPNLTAPPGPAQFEWDNKGPGARGPLALDKVYPVWNKDVPANKEAAEMRLAIEEISKSMVDKKPIDIVLLERLHGPKTSHHTLSLLSLAAIDAVPTLLDILSDEDPAHFHDRNVAIYALRCWMSRNADNGKKLFDPKTASGLLIDKKYSRGDAEKIQELLYPFSDVKKREAATFEALAGYLKLEKIALRELAFWHLIRWSLGVWRPPINLPALPPERREAAVTDLLKLIKEGKLPPPLPMGPR